MRSNANTTEAASESEADRRVQAGCLRSSRSVFFVLFIPICEIIDVPVVRRRLLMVWRREADGQWRIARELLNEDV